MPCIHGNIRTVSHWIISTFEPSSEPSASRMEQVAADTMRSDTLEWRLKTYPLALLMVVAAAFIIVAASGAESSTVGGRLGGDFPAFYTAGSLVATGQIDDLYDPGAQSAQQTDLLGGDAGYLAFAYAPHVALAYAPLSLLHYRLAYVVHTALMVGALIAALSLMRPMVGLVDRWFTLTIAAAIGFYPIFMAVGGGQNTAVSLLLLAAVWRSLRDGHDARAGLVVALLAFRPQYALPMLGLLAIGRHLRAVGWAVIGLGFTWMVDALVMGPSWVSDWLHGVGPFVTKDADVNGHNAVSILGFLQAIMGSGSSVAKLLGAAGSIAVAVIMAWVWHEKLGDLDRRMALTAAGLVLLSPHTMFYDAGLLAITLVVLIDAAPERLWPLFAGSAAAALLQPASAALGFSPFAPVVAVIFVIAARSVGFREHIPAIRTMAAA